METPDPSPAIPPDSHLYIGIDLGTSGCRAIVIDQQGTVVGTLALPWPAPTVEGARVEQDAEIWWQVLQDLLRRLGDIIPTQQVRAMCLDGTSGTVLLADATGKPLAPALMYNDCRASAEASSYLDVAPADCAVHSASSGLAKLLWLKRRHHAGEAHYFLHQTDWVNGRLSGEYGISDVNNSLKTGYDPVRQKWPDWLNTLAIPARWLPRVVRPGTPIGVLRDDLCHRFGFATGTALIAGTTDSTAAFMATGAGRPGEAVTSLGSTLVVKLICEHPVFDRAAGVYSQPYGRYWLAGGGSNSGGRVLRHFFTDRQMRDMEAALDIEHPTGLDYYPLPQTGERFPISDPAKTPRMTPRPDSDVVFFQALLEGIARIEQTGYDKLRQLGAPRLVSVRTVGGGAKNDRWTALRQRLLNVPMLHARHTEAAYGAALLARQAKR